jgi:uncharacterized protein YndB with AHSA1/START domain
MKVREMVQIAAEPTAVWAVLMDVERWPEWTDSITRIARESTGPLEMGSRVVIAQPRLPTTPWVVTALEPGRSFTWEATAPGARTVATHVIEPTDAGCTVTLGIDSSGWASVLLRPLLGGITRRYVAMEAAGLKQRVESGA